MTFRSRGIEAGLCYQHLRSLCAAGMEDYVYSVGWFCVSRRMEMLCMWCGAEQKLDLIDNVVVGEFNRGESR